MVPVCALRCASDLVQSGENSARSVAVASPPGTRGRRGRVHLPSSEAVEPGVQGTALYDGTPLAQTFRRCLMQNFKNGNDLLVAT